MARRAGYDRDEVLARAQALFWRKGYHTTSLKDLEAALNMRPGSIYAAFGSKEALFADIFRVLRPGGTFAASDCLTSHDGEPSPAMRMSQWWSFRVFRSAWLIDVSPSFGCRRARDRC